MEGAEDQASAHTHTYTRTHARTHTHTHRNWGVVIRASAMAPAAGQDGEPVAKGVKHPDTSSEKLVP